MSLLLSYFGCRYPPHFRQDLAEIVSLGFDGVIHTVSEADALYSADVLAEMRLNTEQAGLTAIADPWGLCKVFAGEATSSWEDAGCWDNPKLIEHVRWWLDVVKKAGFKWILWDEPRTNCEHCFGREHLFLSLCTEAAKMRGMKSILGFSDDILERMGIDQVKQIPHVSNVMLSCYVWTDYSNKFLVKKTKWWAKTLKELKNNDYNVYAWVQGFSLPPGNEEVPIIIMSLLQSEGIKNFAYWGWDACSPTSSIAAGPDAWQVFKDHISPPF